MIDETFIFSPTNTNPTGADPTPKSEQPLAMSSKPWSFAQLWAEALEIDSDQLRGVCPPLADPLPEKAKRFLAEIRDALKDTADVPLANNMIVFRRQPSSCCRLAAAGNDTNAWLTFAAESESLRIWRRCNGAVALHRVSHSNTEGKNYANAVGLRLGAQTLQFPEPLLPGGRATLDDPAAAILLDPSVESIALLLANEIQCQAIRSE